MRFEERRAAERSASLLADMLRRLRDLERHSQMSFTAVEGSVVITDSAGDPIIIIGEQDDGSVGVDVLTPVVVPPAPSAPTLTPTYGGLMVGWNGTYEGGAAPPAQFAHVEVHASPVAGFAATPSTIVETIDTARGAVKFVALGHVQQYVRLVAITTPGGISAAGAQATEKPYPVAPMILLENGAAVPTDTPVGTLIFEKLD